MQSFILLFQKLEFTVAHDEPKSPDAKTLSMESIQQELDALMIRKKADNETVFNWIEVCN